jgi:hypothetical protein
MGLGWGLPPGCSLADIDALLEDVVAPLTDEEMAAMILLVPILPLGNDFEFNDEDLP